MTPQPILPHELQACIEVVKTANGGLSMTETPEGSRARQRAVRFIDCIVRKQLTPQPSGAEELVLCALEFEALRTEEELSDFLQALKNPIPLGDEVIVSWSRRGRTERRALSVFTCLAAKGLDLDGLMWPAILQDVRSRLAKWYPFTKAIPLGDRMRNVLNDARSLWCAVLPKPLAFHFLGIQELTLLPESCWTRRTTRAPAPRAAATLQSEPARKIEELIIEALCNSSSSSLGGWFVTLLTNVCNGLNNPGIRRTNAVVWRELEGKLHGLALEVGTAGPRAALLLGWALDITRFGSARRADPAIKTLANYLRAACMPLFNAMSAQRADPLSLDDEEWGELIDKLLADKNDPLLRPALASFHRYLVREHGIAPRPALLRLSCEVRTPRSNIVWEHEFAALTTELQRQIADGRCQEQLMVWRALFKHTSLRIGELVGLSLHDVHITETLVRIQVTSVGRTSLKSQAARRTLEIHDVDARDVISRWIQKRRNEALTGSELMFADPYSPSRVYRFPQCYVAFSRALKVVTGDEQVSPHITRHSFLSLRAEHYLLQCIEGIEEPNPLEMLRCEAGHARVETTFATYAHLVERPTRESMDAFLHSRMARACDVARWTGETCAAIRQRRHRDRNWSSWLTLRAALPANTQRASINEAPSGAGTAAAAALTVESLLKIARDWLEGRTIAATSSRCGINQHTVEQAIEAIALACRQVCAVRGTKGVQERNWRAWIADECDFRRLTHPRWERAAQLVAAQDLLSHVPAWLFLCARGGIDLADHRAESLLRFLHAASFGPDHFVVKATTEELAKEARVRFRSTFAVFPAAELVAPRRGRNPSYALLLTACESGDRLVPGRSSEMKPLLALLVTAYAYQCTLAKAES